MANSVSCFYMYYKNKSINITFIKFVNYIKVIFNSKSVILTFNQLISNYELFQIYLLSLILTENTLNINIQIINNKIIYGISTIKCLNNNCLNDSYDIVILEKRYYKNPLNAKEPKRSTSSKKINKFMWMFNSIIDIIDINPMYLFQEYYLNETYDIYNFIKTI